MDEILKQAVDICSQFGASKVVLFGSWLHPNMKHRDLDLACEGVSGWEFYKLGATLERRLRIPVDLVPLDPPTRFTRMIERRGRRLL